MVVFRSAPDGRSAVAATRAAARAAAAELGRAQLFGRVLRGFGVCEVGPMAVFAAADTRGVGGGVEAAGGANVVWEATEGCWGAGMAVEAGVAILPAVRASESCARDCAHLTTLAVAHVPTSVLAAAPHLRLRPLAAGLPLGAPLWLRTRAVAGEDGGLDSMSLRVVLVGDSQSGARVFRRLLGTAASRYRAPAPPLDLLLHVGDTVQASADAREAALYLFAPLAALYEDLGYAVPTLLVRGNHDDADRTSALSLAPSIRARARARTHIQPGSLQPLPLYRVLAAPPLRVLALDTDDESGDQLSWLTRACEHAVGSAEGAPLPFTLALAHVPPYIDFWDPRAWAQGESAWQDYSRRRLLPALRCCAGARLLVSGHVHAYARGWAPPLEAAPAATAAAAAAANDCPSLGGASHALMLATIGGAGGALEDTRVGDSGVYAVTALAHHWAALDVAAGNANASWRVYGLSGELLDEVLFAVA